MAKRFEIDIEHFSRLQESVVPHGMKKLLKEQELFTKSLKHELGVLDVPDIDHLSRASELVEDFSKWHGEILGQTTLISEMMAKHGNLASSIEAFSTSGIFKEANKLAAMASSLQSNLAISSQPTATSKVIEETMQMAVKMFQPALDYQSATDKIMEMANAIETGKHWNELRWLAGVIPSIDFDQYELTTDTSFAVNIEEVQDRYDSFTDALSNEKDDSKLRQRWSELPRPLQFLITFYLISLLSTVIDIFNENVVIPSIIDGISSISDNFATVDRNKKKAIKAVPSGMYLYVDNGIRFISGKSVHLRASGSIKSKVIYTLDFGTVVYIQEKHRSWSKVSVYLDDGETLEGWVFTEYTERFR